MLYEVMTAIEQEIVQLRMQQLQACNGTLCIRSETAAFTFTVRVQYEMHAATTPGDVIVVHHVLQVGNGTTVLQQSCQANNKLAKHRLGLWYGYDVQDAQYSCEPSFENETAPLRYVGLQQTNKVVGGLLVSQASTTTAVSMSLVASMGASAACVAAADSTGSQVQQYRFEAERGLSAEQLQCPDVKW